MYPLVRFLYFASAMFYCFALIFGYYQMPDHVAISLNEKIGLRDYIEKNTLFNVGVVVFFTINILMYCLRVLIEKLPVQSLKFPNKTFWSTDPEHKLGFYKVVKVWFDSFMTVINFYLGAILLFLFMINNHEMGTFWTYRYWIWSGACLISLWWIVLWIRLKISKIDL